MSSAAPKSEAEEDKISLLSAELDEVPVDDEVTRTGLSVKPDERASEKSSHDGQQYLEAPRFGPIRPLSPDTLSNLSADEYEPGRPNLGRRVGSYRQPSRSPAPPRTWRGKLQASWIRNKGLFYMLLAQVFGTLMNVTTRLLEVEGNKGKGLHPFQVRSHVPTRPSISPQELIVSLRFCLLVWELHSCSHPAICGIGKPHTFLWGCQRYDGSLLLVAWAVSLVSSECTVSVASLVYSFPRG